MTTLDWLVELFSWWKSEQPHSAGFGNGVRIVSGDSLSLAEEVSANLIPFPSQVHLSVHPPPSSCHPSHCPVPIDTNPTSSGGPAVGCRHAGTAQVSPKCADTQVIVNMPLWHICNTLGCCSSHCASRMFL